MAKTQFHRRKWLNPYRRRMQAIRLAENQAWSRIAKWNEFTEGRLAEADLWRERELEELENHDL